MTAVSIDDWRAVCELFERAGDLPADEVTDWSLLVEAGEHRHVPVLKRLLAARDSADRMSFLQELPAFDVPVPDSLWLLDAGMRVGGYQLIRHVGSGGMADVWLARRADGAFQREVALKILRGRASPDQRETMAARFARERDILSRLEHPLIAPLLDAGVTVAGQPWLALSFVDGVAITEWCDARCASLRQRVALFVEVLRAVEHAHANLVIHRDLKPSNVLVTPAGEVRLLDFGIAKLLSDQLSCDETELTAMSGRPLTLSYASPEQIDGRTLTTATDVYSLGVVLHELVVGVRPHQSSHRSAAQLEDAVLREDPRPPSHRIDDASAAGRGMSTRALRREVAGDLDAIVVTALSKQPRDRFGSIESFRLDLERWLRHEPALAASPGPIHRTVKFVQRHRAAASTTLLVVALVTATSGWAVLKGRDARTDADRAAAARAFVFDLFRSAEMDGAKERTMTAADLLAAGRRRAVEGLATQPRLRADVLRNLGEIQINIGAYAQAAETLAQAVADMRALDDVRGSALTRLLHADAAYQADDLPAARRELDSAERTLEAVFADGKGWRGDLAFVRGQVARAVGDPIGAAKGFSAAVDALTGAKDGHFTTAVEALVELSSVESEMRMHASAIERLDRAAELMRTSGADTFESVRVGIRRAEAELVAGRYAAGLPDLERAAADCDRLLGVTNENCAMARIYQSHVLVLSGDAHAAMRLAPSLARLASADGTPKRSAEAKVELCHLLAVNGLLAGEPGLLADLRAIADDPELHSEQIRQDARFASIEARLLTGRFSEVIDMATRALAGTGGNGVTPLASGRLFRVRGLAYQALGRNADAMVDLELARDRAAEGFGADHPIPVLIGLNRVRSLVALGQAPKARLLLDHAEPIVSSAFGNDSVMDRRVKALKTLSDGRRPSFTTGVVEPASLFL